MNQKKETKGEIERRIKSSILFVPKTRDTKTIYFDDKGLKITITDDYAVISTGAHSHVFDKLTLSGISRPYMYAEHFVDIALNNDCKVKNAKGETVYSYSKLFELLKGKEEKLEYNLAWYVDLWLMNIFAPLYSIAETEVASFMVYEEYLHNIARQVATLEEKTEDVTNLQFVDKVITLMKKYIEGISETVIFPKKTDEQRMQQEIDALQQVAIEKDIINESDGDGK